MASSSEPKKSLYHSELVRLSPVLIEVTGTPTKSTFDGRPDFVSIIIDGWERTLNLENDQIKSFFTGLRGHKLWVRASGGKGQVAQIQHVAAPPVDPNAPDASHPDLVPEMPLQRPAPAASAYPQATGPGISYPAAAAPSYTAPASAPVTLNPPRPPAAAPVQQPLPAAPAPRQAPPQKSDAEKAREAFKAAVEHSARVRNVLKLAYFNGIKLKEEIEAEKPGAQVSDAQLQGFVSMQAIQLFRDGIQRALPADYMRLAKGNGNGHGQQATPPAAPPFNSEPDPSDLANEGFAGDNY